MITSNLNRLFGFANKIVNNQQLSFISTTQAVCAPTKKIILPHKSPRIINPTEIEQPFFDPSRLSKEELEKTPCYVHSEDTFGTLDGPGTRFLLYLTGCPFRCSYCHNPDTWKMSEGNKRTLKGVMNQYEQCLPYYTKTGGGITVSGGEPFLQPEFLSAMFYYIKKYSQGTTCVETAGFGTEKSYNSVLKNTDV